jgi:hypothetical protein
MPPYTVLPAPRTVIYKIHSIKKDTTDIYIGSTKDFSKRYFTHKNNCINPNSKYHHNKVYEFIRNNGNFLYWNITVVEEINYDISTQELHKLEQHYIDTLHATLNTYKSYVEKKPKIEFKPSDNSISCICGGYYTAKHKGKHMLTVKHINAIKV